MVNPLTPLKYTGPNKKLVPFVDRDRAPIAPLSTSPDVKFPGGGYYDISTIWRDSSSGTFYILISIDNNLAHWEKFTGSLGTVTTLSEDANTKVDPDDTGNIQVKGTAKQCFVLADVSNHFLQLSLVKPITQTDTGQMLIWDGGGTTGGYDVVGLEPGYKNLGFTYSASIFSLTAKDGTALSATNPAFVTMQRKGAPGRNKTYRIVTPYSFVDSSGGAPTITGNLWGTLNTDLWNQDMPFYVYLVSDSTDTTVTPMISRDPSARISSATVGKPGSPVIGQFDFWAFDSGITLANYANNPCICIGAFRMRKTIVTGGWVVQALSINDGVGQLHEQTWFTIPTGVFGASASNYFIPNGGTPPTITPVFYVYRMGRDGFVDHEFECVFTGSGAGAVQGQLIIPFNYSIPGGSSGAGHIWGVGFFYDFSAGGLAINIFPWKPTNIAGFNYMIFSYQNSTATFFQYITAGANDIFSLKMRAKLY